MIEWDRLRSENNGEVVDLGPLSVAYPRFSSSSLIYNYCLLKNYIDYFLTNTALLNDKVE